MGEIPTYEEAVSEAHRSGHEPTWEIQGETVTCSLCGWSYRLT